MLTRASLKNPYAVFVICTIMLVLGGVSYQTMCMDNFPETKIPAILVTPFYRGLNPSEEDNLSRFKNETIAEHSGSHEADDAVLRGDLLARHLDSAATPLVASMEDSHFL